MNTIEQIVGTINDMINDPVAALTAGGSLWLTGFLADVHDALSDTSMFIGCLIGLAVLRVWILKGNILKRKDTDNEPE